MSWTFLRGVRLELTWPPASRAPWYGIAGTLCLLLLGLLGATITPSQPEHRLLDRAQWQMLAAQRQLRQEVVRMTQDLSQLVRMTAGPQLQPVEAVWMAQRLYSRYQEGAPASAATRQALIEAGRIAVQVASGASPPESLETALHTVQQRLVRLQTP